MKYFCMLLGLATLVFLIGPGCGGSSIFGFNSNVVITFTSNNIGEFDIIVTPLSGSAASTTACRSTAPLNWCTVEFGQNFKTIRFRTNSQASSRPYYVYLRNNNTTENRNGTLEINMTSDTNEQSNYNSNIFLTPDTTALVARVFRNNVSGPE
jgi:hypothetical protein